MKKGTTGRKVGPLKIMGGHHADGAPLELKVLVRACVLWAGGWAAAYSGRDIQGAASKKHWLAMQSSTGGTLAVGFSPAVQ